MARGKVRQASPMVGEVVKEVGMNPTAVNATCEWKPEEEGSHFYDAKCGGCIEFDYGTPKDNHFYYCPYCGGDIIQVEADE